MKNSKIEKFESVSRIAELNPLETLKRAGMNENMVLCDIGAGTGLFSFPAADMSKKTIYALEISEDMIALLESRKKERSIENLEIKKVESRLLPLENNACDIAIMVTVFHEIEDKTSILHEIKRLLKINGKLMIIEFHKKDTPMGPPVEHRLSIEDVEQICNNQGFNTMETFSLGDNFYGIVLEQI